MSGLQPCGPDTRIVSFYGEEPLAPRPTTQAAGPSLIGCPGRLVQYISQLPSTTDAVSPSVTWGSAMKWRHGPTYHGRSVL